MKRDAIDGISRWLIDQALRGSRDIDVFRGFCERLVEGGLPLLRANVSHRTLHPLYAGHAHTWWRGDPIESSDWERTVAQADDGFEKSPFYALIVGGLDQLRVRLDASNEPAPYPLLDRFRERGATDYLGLKTLFEESDNLEREAGMVSSWTTDEPGGFDDHQIAALHELGPVLALHIKSAGNYRMARSLMETYLGKDAGRRVMSGEIDRGKAHTMRAVLWYCDLQGFTRISEAASQDDVLRLLNDYLEVIVGAIQKRGGQVLKFMGDGLLAIFPLDERVTEPVCRIALDTADDVSAQIAELNRRRSAEQKPVTDFYIALHLGDVLYGNIGSRDRLDFTVVGPAVNEVSRIEAMCRPLEQSILVSAAFAEASQACHSGRLVSLGRYALRGVRRPQELFTLVAPGEGS
jgi:adenylate cyclase